MLQCALCKRQRKGSLGLVGTEVHVWLPTCKSCLRPSNALVDLHVHTCTRACSRRHGKPSAGVQQCHACVLSFQAEWNTLYVDIST